MEQQQRCERFVSSGAQQACTRTQLSPTIIGIYQFRTGRQDYSEEPGTGAGIAEPARKSVPIPVILNRDVMPRFSKLLGPVRGGLRSEYILADLMEVARSYNAIGSFALSCRRT